MNVEQFLARVVGPGGYLAIAFKDPTREGGMGHRWFKRDDLKGAIGFLNWSYERQNSDAYFALAGFSATSVGPHVDDKGKPLASQLRTAANAEALAAFWLDLDVARPGDGKDPSRVYSDRRAALAWLFTFCQNAAIPRPNLIVDSGYGFHCYWTLAEGISRADWQPYADALKYAIHQHGYVGDLQRVADAASVLRPIGSINRKGGGAAPVSIVPGSVKDDYPNDVMLAALQPYVGKGITTTVVATQMLGAMPAFMQGSQIPNQVAAAQAGVQQHRSASFAKIATRCLQVQVSLAENGANDAYPTWYLGHLSLAHHCADGADFVHEIGKGSVKYSPAGTDAAVMRLAGEKAIKDTGPPRCSSYDTNKPGICTQCPFHGKIASPWVLGKDTGDLPKHYRRERGWLEANVKVNEEYKWLPVVEGDVFNPTLDLLPQGYALNFTYEFADKKFPVRAEPDMPSDTGALVQYFNKQHMSLQDNNALRFRRFIMAWIEHMRRAHLERDEIIRPFGYATNAKGERTGVAVGGTVFRPDGSTEPAAGGDPLVVKAYTPTGTATPWRHAYDLVCNGRIDLQVIVAAAFGAPLMTFTGEHGVVLSAYSPHSGAGKSSAIKVGNAVWAGPTQITSINPTYNALMQKLGNTSIFPFYWDEMSWGKEDREVVKAIMNVSQGTSKDRLDMNMHQREVLTWQTILVVAGNAPVSDAVERGAAFTDATALRMMEFCCEIPSTTVVSTATVASATNALKMHYGHVGRDFLMHVAANLQDTEKKVVDMIEYLTVKWSATRGERLYLAGIAAMIVGASIANRLQIAAFDIMGMTKFFHQIVVRSRGERGGLVANDKGYDVERVLAEFQTAHFGNILVTKKFIKRGPKPKDWENPYRSPGPGALPCYIHYSVEDKRLWVNKGQFTEWLRRKGYAASSVLADMKRAWDTAENRRVIGGGTHWATGQLPTLEIPVDTPRMVQFIPQFEISNEQVAKMGLPIPEDDPADLPEAA